MVKASSLGEQPRYKPRYSRLRVLLEASHLSKEKNEAKNLNRVLPD
jgi:hypothetical protein